MSLVCIDSGYFFAGVIVENGVVVRAAPILRYMLGWDQERVISYIEYKEWTHEVS